jgi:hypothetical protein
LELTVPARLHHCRRRSAVLANFLDDAARILASPIPRRRALKLLGGALAGVFAGTFAATTASADTKGTKCGNITCPAGATCCTTGSQPFCATDGKNSCCGDNKADINSQICCTTGDRPFVGTKGKTCCGNSTCDGGTHMCCTTGTTPFVGTKGKTCCGNSTADSDHMCCNTGTQPFVGTKGKTCCGNTTCPEHYSCVHGRCSASAA